jgi:hypothetical protein
MTDLMAMVHAARQKGEINERVDRGLYHKPIQYAERQEAHKEGL